MTISMSAIWDESIALVKRERHLLVPLALATIGIGSAASALVQPEPGQAGSVKIVVIAMLAANLIKLIGSLAIIALVLKPGLSVAEGIQLAVARIPKMLVFILLYSLAVIVVMLPAVIALLPTLLASKSGTISMQTAIQDLPPQVLLLALIGMIVLLYAGMRLVTLNVIIIDKNPSVMTAMRTAYAQSRGLVFKLICVLLLFVIVGTVISGAAMAVLGSLFVLVGKSLGLPLLGKMVAALVGGMVEALFSILLAVFITKLYLKLTAK